MKTKADIQETLSRHKSRLFRDYPIKSMAIFGSYTRKQQNEDSDLDILIDCSPTIGIRFVDLAEELEEITGLKVDLVSKNGIKDKYLKSIDSDLTYV